MPGTAGETKRHSLKKTLFIVLAVLLALVLAAGTYIYLRFFNLHPETLPGNAEIYSVAQTQVNNDSSLKGKRIIFLGSSVVYGYGSLGESFVDYLEKEDGVIAVKEAVSGTTLVDQSMLGKKSYIERMKEIDPNIEADLFVCQLSTNDATTRRRLGTISDSTDISSFNTHTVTGAIEYIIAYAQQTWDCPVVFFASPQYDSKTYEAMTDRLLEVADKWNISVLDLWHDEEMRSVSSDDYALYMADEIHPTKAGYREWFTPKFETFLEEYFKT